MTHIAIVIYSMYQHVSTMAEQVKAGIETTGATATIYQVPETLPEEVLTAMHAPAKGAYEIATPAVLESADGILFGCPTRFGAFPSQIKSFIDSTGGQWASGALYHKPCGVFVSTGSGGGRETTIFSLISSLAHHGMLYIPLGYTPAFAELSNIDELHGSSAWGAGTIAGSDGSRQPTELETKVARIQGKEFADAVVRLSGKKEVATTTETTEPVAEPVAETKPVVETAAAVETPVKSAQAPVEKKKNPVKRFFTKLGKLFD